MLNLPQFTNQLYALFSKLFSGHNHNHNGTYSPDDHNHTGTYSLIDHTHTGGAAAPGARVYNSGNVSVSGQIALALPFTHSIHNVGPSWAVGNPTRLIAISTGVYLVGCNVRWPYNTAGTRQIWIQSGGTVWDTQVDLAAVNGGQAQQRVQTVLTLSANQYVEFYLYHSEYGEDLTCYHFNHYSLEAWIQKID